MIRKYRPNTDLRPHFVTLNVIDSIDLFTRNQYRDVISSSIKHCQINKALEVYAYCFMTSQIHLLIGARGHLPLRGIVRDLKAFTSKSIRNILETSTLEEEARRDWMLTRMYTEGIANPNNFDFQLWRQNSEVIELPSDGLIFGKMEYIHQCPVAAGYVSRAEHWIHSSARDYAGIATGGVRLSFLI